VVELTIDGGLLAVAPNPSVDRLLEVGGVRHDGINRPAGVTVVPGGKGFNVARAAATLGAPVTAVGLLGGHAGRWIADGLAAEGIVVAAVWRIAETRTCTSILDRTDGTTTEFNEPGPPLEEGEWRQLVAAVTSSLAGDGSRLVTVSGSLPPGAPDDGLAQIIGVARSAGRRVAVDGHGRALVKALGARPWLVKVNLDEANEALGLPASPGAGRDERRNRTTARLQAAAALIGLLGAGAERAIVTIGATGSFAALEDGSIIEVTPPLRGPYGVGSGDAFLAGLAVTILSGGDLRSGVVHATAAAAASSLVPGAGRLDLATVRRLIDDVSVETIG